jgi:phosphoserine phosphatase RsbU/P
MSSPPPAVQSRPGLRSNARNFWHRVTEGLALSQLWSQFEKDARSSYRLYSAGLDSLEVERSRFRRGRQIAKSLFWAILEKLTPARRVLVLLGLILLFFPSATSSYADRTGACRYPRI